MPNRGWKTAVLSVTAVALLLGGCGKAANQPQSQATTNNQTAQTPAPTERKYSGPVVATYNGGELTKEELDQQYNLLVVIPGGQQQTKAQFLKQYVTLYKYLYGQAVKDSKTPVNTAQAEQMSSQAITQLSSAQHATKQAFLNKMKTMGLTQDDLTLFFEKQQYLNEYVQNQLKGVQVTDAEAQAYYNAHKSDYLKVTVEHILVNSLAQAKSIEKQLKAGANFAKLADKYSQDPGVKQNHGKYPDSTVSSFVPEFAKACETLPIGKISDPVHTQFGYHVMKVDSRMQQKFSDVKDEIKQTLLQQKQQQKEQDILTSAQTAAHIKITAKSSDL